jgi:hypothetical protein
LYPTAAAAAAVGQEATAAGHEATALASRKSTSDTEQSLPLRLGLTDMSHALVCDRHNTAWERGPAFLSAYIVSCLQARAAALARMSLALVIFRVTFVM